jgi:hypothetical protein
MRMPGFDAEASLDHPDAVRRHYRQSVLAGNSFHDQIRPQQSSCEDMLCTDGTLSTGQFPFCQCPTQIRCREISCPDGSASTGEYPDCICPAVGRCEDTMCWDGSQSTDTYPDCSCPVQPNCSDIICPDESISTGTYPNCACPTDPPIEPPAPTCSANWICPPDLVPYGQWPECGCKPEQVPFPRPGTATPDPFDVPFYPGSGGVAVCNQFFVCGDPRTQAEEEEGRRMMDVGDDGQCYCHK